MNCPTPPFPYKIYNKIRFVYKAVEDTSLIGTLQQTPIFQKGYLDGQSIDAGILKARPNGECWWGCLEMRRRLNGIPSTISELKSVVSETELALFIAGPEKLPMSMQHLSIDSVRDTLNDILADMKKEFDKNCLTWLLKNPSMLSDAPGGGVENPKDLEEAISHLRAFRRGELKGTFAGLYFGRLEGREYGTELEIRLASLIFDMDVYIFNDIRKEWSAVIMGEQVGRTPTSDEFQSDRAMMLLWDMQMPHYDLMVEKTYYEQKMSSVRALAGSSSTDAPQSK